MHIFKSILYFAFEQSKKVGYLLQPCSWRSERNTCILLWGYNPAGKIVNLMFPIWYWTIIVWTSRERMQQI